MKDVIFATTGQPVFSGPPLQPDPIMDAYGIEYELLREYYASGEFKAYLLAKLDWETAHAVYIRTDSETDRAALMAAWSAMDTALAACRALPTYKAAFGC